MINLVVVGRLAAGAVPAGCPVGCPVGCPAVGWSDLSKRRKESNFHTIDALPGT